MNEDDTMKIIANEYSPNDIIRIIREWTELTQKEFGKSIHRSEKGIQAFELGTRNFVQSFYKIKFTSNHFTSSHLSC